MPETLTADSRSVTSPLKNAESSEETAQPMEGMAAKHYKISPLDYYYSENVIESGIQPAVASTSSQPPSHEADQEMASASSRGASPL